MTDRTDDLPPLPDTDYFLGVQGDVYGAVDRLLSEPAYTDEHMHAYAAAAVAAERERWQAVVIAETLLALQNAQELEREACAKIAESTDQEYESYTGRTMSLNYTIAEAIRARGKHD